MASTATKARNANNGPARIATIFFHVDHLENMTCLVTQLMSNLSDRRWRAGSSVHGASELSPHTERRSMAAIRWRAHGAYIHLPKYILDSETFSARRSDSSGEFFLRLGKLKR